ncbi:hypothetical protein [Bdellovibrio sp. NC01]|uniref:hypothetical protein n=1 Tax=Bdellovibrio sp. NC01 TaxID=2220073 RepID=UPI001156EAED|nr:hypothetical protein [Bdellovibrio sp. NC01]QDK36701.1 hypothetical protein DOE51_03335 [Bdellovibrio sp. NC01]
MKMQHRFILALSASLIGLSYAHAMNTPDEINETKNTMQAPKPKSEKPKEKPVNMPPPRKTPKPHNMEPPIAKPVTEPEKMKKLPPTEPPVPGEQPPISN